MTFVPDYHSFDPAAADGVEDTRSIPISSKSYQATKRAFDLVFVTVVLLPATLVAAFILVLLNPILNPGPLLYAQKRMGRNCRPFRALKFRTMTVRARTRRGPDDPIEADRITPLGRWLRRTRFDELPQILNVYRGDMSLIGPRPDYFRHAHHYMRTIPAYRDRHMVRPGISGLAQIELGYSEGTEATRVKTLADIDYIRRATLLFDLWIFWRTIVTVIRMRGA
jgi:lipopolysaccharide/colanic/teichoic acid biosynthesis glycosyltransferase